MKETLSSIAAYIVEKNHPLLLCTVAFLETFGDVLVRSRTSVFRKVTAR
jgi:hypothetical protein